MNYTTDPINKYMLLTAGDYPVHSAANVVPLDTCFEPLEESIKRSGLIDPITLYEGKILDGRRRAIVCKTLGIPVREDEISSVMGKLTEKEIYEFVLAKNNRRSLSKAQLAMIAAIEVGKNSHNLMGISNATEYAKKVWGVSKVTYEKARYISKNNQLFAEEIFSTGYCVINNEKHSMAQTYDYIKKQMVTSEFTAGSPNYAMLAKSLDAVIDGYSFTLSNEQIVTILNNKIKSLLGK